MAAVLTAQITPSAALAAISEIPQTQELSPANTEDISSGNTWDDSAEVLSEYAVEDSEAAFTEVPAEDSIDDPSNYSVTDDYTGYDTAEDPAGDVLANVDDTGENPEDISGEDSGGSLFEAPADPVAEGSENSTESPEIGFESDEIGTIDPETGSESDEIGTIGPETGSEGPDPADSAAEISTQTAEVPAEEFPEAVEQSGEEFPEAAEQTGEDSADNSNSVVFAEIPTESTEDPAEESMEAAEQAGEDSADNSNPVVSAENSTESAEDPAAESMEAAEQAGEDSIENFNSVVFEEISTQTVEDSTENVENPMENAENTEEIIEKSGEEPGVINEMALPGEDEEIAAEDSVNAADDHPVIALTDVPAYGERRNLSGVVFMPEGMDDSAFDPSSYKVTMYLQTTENGEYWVKPTQAKPYFEIGEDGSFSDNFITGGSGDLNAKVLHLLLIPSEYQPSLHGFHDALSQAVDYVLITRTEEGDVTVSPEREAPEIRPAFRQVLPVSAQTIAVNVGFYTENGSQPGGALSMETIRQQLEAVAGFADTVRFYSSGGEVQKAYGAAHDMGFSIVGTAWLTKENTEANRQANQAELDALINNCNNGYVQAACVGSETLLRGDLTAESLIEKIRYVRSQISEDIPVTTADSWDILLGSVAVRNACDLLMPNCYPYWGGESINDASESFARSMASLQAAARSKQIIVSETGWPTAGQTKGNAVPGADSAARYFSEVREWSLSTGTQVLWFDAVDEPWKGLTEEGEAGAHWGLMTNDFVFKGEFAETDFFRTALTISDNNTSVSGIQDKSCSGSPVTQAPVVRIGLKTLSEGIDYVVSYADTLHAGTARMTITGKGNYRGSITRTFKIRPVSIASASVSGLKSVTYTGKALTQSPVVKVGSTILVSGTHYTVSYKNNINAGTATLTITGKGDYTGTRSLSFSIMRKDVSASSITVTGITAKTYTGKALTQSPVVKDGTTTLVSGTHYTVSYKNNTNAGTATVTITGKGNYTGTRSVTFKINKAAQSITVKSSASSVPVGKTAAVTITGNKGTKSYKSSNTAVATVNSSGVVTAKKVGTVTITAASASTSNYNAASKTLTIKVVPAATASLTASNLATGIKLSWKAVSGSNGYKIYRNSTLIKTITSGSTVTFTDTKANTNGTKYVYKVVAKASTGDSTLSKSQTVYRVARPAISSATNSAASRMTVKWGKNAKATGYEIQYSTSKTFASGNKTVTAAGASTVSKVITGLTKGKTYYVRIRAFKTVNSTKYRSAWSTVKSVKIQK